MVPERFLRDFSVDTVEADMTIVISYSKIDEKGNADITASSGSAEVDFGKDALKSATVEFSERTKIDMAKSGCGETITVSLSPSGDDRYRTVPTRER